MALRRRAEDQQGPRRLEVDASMTGTLSFKDPVNLQINGQFEGTLDTKGTLAIGEKARVKATIRGEEMTIAGTVEGTITAARRLELAGTARVIGKVVTPRLIVAEGALLHGTCEMMEAGAEAASMDLEELARYLEIDANTVLDWAQSGRLPARQEGGRWRFDRRQVEEWLAREKVK